MVVNGGRSVCDQWKAPSTAWNESSMQGGVFKYKAKNLGAL